MKNISTETKIICSVSTILSLLFSTGSGIYALLKNQSITYEPELAILTITLVAIIWYTGYTYETIQYLKKKDSADTSMKRKSIATSLLGELKKQYFYFYEISVRGNYSPQFDLSLPILDYCVKNNISLFDPSTSELLASLHRENNYIIYLLNGSTQIQFQEKQTFIADVTILLSKLVKNLVEYGGIVPQNHGIVERTAFGAVTAENFPNDPFHT